ncbi:MAG: hypothetical protein ACTSO7_09060 [Candidatus Heimdallarchaeota archaeon]
MTKKAQIELLKSEAEANYSASRWEDSAKTYEHLVGLAQDNNELSLAIDFAIAAIRAWENMPDKNARILRLYQAIGIIGLKKAALGYESLAKEAEQQGNKKLAATNYEVAADGYNYIMNYNLAKDYYLVSIKLFEGLGAEVSKSNDHESAIHLNDKVCSLYSKLAILIGKMIIDKKKDLTEDELKAHIAEKKGAEKSCNGAKKKIAKSHEQLALTFLKENESEYNQIALKELKKALVILEAIDDTKEVAKIKDKIKKIKV